MFISDYLPVRKQYLNCNIIENEKMQGYCDVFYWTLLRWASPEAICLHQTSSDVHAKFYNMIYHKIPLTFPSVCSVGKMLMSVFKHTVILESLDFRCKHSKRDMLSSVHSWT